MVLGERLDTDEPAGERRRWAEVAQAARPASSRSAASRESAWPSS
jgi:hypothetical protein